MKVVHSPSPSADIRKKAKPNLFEANTPDEIAAMRSASTIRESNKVLFRVDTRTEVMVHPRNATPEYAEKLRTKYKLTHHSKE